MTQIAFWGVGGQSTGVPHHVCPVSVCVYVGEREQSRGD
jgi:hypothetical protein